MREFGSRRREEAKADLATERNDCQKFGYRAALNGTLSGNHEVMSALHTREIVCIVAVGVAV